MSDYSIISHVSEAIRRQLSEALKTFAAQPATTVGLGPPQAKPDKDSLSVWLYRVNRNGDLANNGKEMDSSGRWSDGPLPIDLHYLITPQFTQADTEQKVLGRVMQWLYSYPKVDWTTSTVNPPGYEIRITPELLTVEQHSQIWQSLSLPFRLSISYLVQCVRIDSLRPPQTRPPVTTSEVKVDQILTSTQM